MKSAGRTMVQGAFPALEAGFLAQARALRAQGPRLQPFAVLAPNDLLRRRLSRALAESGCAHANIHFLTVRNLAERLAGRRLALAGFSSLRRHGLELTVAMAAAARELEPKLEYFRLAAQQDGFQRAMLETFRDLKDAGLRPQDVKRAAELLPPREENLLRRKLTDAALLWERIERAKDEHKLYDEADLLEAAAEEAAGSPWLRGLAQFIIYGFYDLTGSQQRLLEACFSRAPATVYFPYCEEESWRYAKPAREWFLAKGFVRMPNAECRMPNEAAETLIISAPGEAREVAEVVREILFSPSSGTDAPRIGILLRSDAGYMELLHDALATAEVKAYFPEGPALSRLPAGRALLDLAGLAGSRLRRAEVMDFVTSAPLRPVEFPPGAQPVEDYPAEWNAFTIEAGIVEGRKEWEERLPNVECRMPNAEFSLPAEASAFAEASADKSAKAGAQNAERAEAAAKAVSLRAFRAFLKQLFDGLEEVAGQRTWKGFAAALSGLYQALIAPDEHTGDVLEALDELSGLDPMGLAPTLEQFRARVRQILEETRPPLGRFERNEPAVVKLMAARGVAFDVVVVPGLVEKFFPQPARQDPILLDSERKRLNELLARAGIANREKPPHGGTTSGAKTGNSGKGLPNAEPAIVIPLKGRRREEEELLFALAAQSARGRLVLTFPRLDAANARQRVPSYFLLRLIEPALSEVLRPASPSRFAFRSGARFGAGEGAAPGKPADYAALEKFLQSAPRGEGPGRVAGRRVPMNLLDPAARDRAVTALEYDLSSFGKAAADKTPNALLYLKQSGTFFDRARAAESERWGNESFTKYDGVVQSQDLLRTLGKRLHDDASPVSPTRLEEYATCPFSYLLRHVFGLEPVEEPERATTLSPMHRGSLVHKILWQFLSEAVRDKVLPLAESHWPRLAAVAEARFEEFERRGVTGYPLMWRIEKERIREELREFLGRESAEAEPFRPAYFEVRFGMRPREPEESEISTEAPALLELAAEAPVRFCGKMDRVDVDAAGKRCRVLDYKTGVNRLKLRDGSFHGGQALQLPIYLLGARRVLPQFEPEYAEYFYTSDRGKWQRVRFTGQDLKEKKATLQFIVRTILDGIRAGRFFPLPEEADCDRCELRLACGHGRFLEFKWNADRRATTAFREMAEIP